MNRILYKVLTCKINGMKGGWLSEKNLNASMKGVLLSYSLRTG